VRCSKCRHVFLAGAEQKPEESEFDAILSGLGASAPEKAPEAAPAAFGFDEEPAAESATQAAAGQPGPDLAGRKPAAVPEQDLGDFDFTPEPPREPSPETAANPLDYGEFDFNEEPAALKQQEPAADESFDFGEVQFAAGPATGGEQPAPATGGMEFGDFEFDEEPVVATTKELPPAADNLDFGEFSFDEETAPKDEKPAPLAEALDFGEFSFDEETAPMDEKPAPAAAEALDFGEFSFDEETAPMDEKPAPAAAEAPDFGEFSFDEETVPKDEKPAPAATEAPDFGEFSFEEESAPKEEMPAPVAAEAIDFGDFSFEEEPPLIQEAPGPGASDDFGLQPAASVPDEEFSFGELSFSEEPEPEPARGAETVPPAAATGLAGAAGFFGAAETPQPETAVAPVRPAESGKPAAQESPLDFSFGDKPFAAAVPEEGPGYEEELPPLSIASRRKGRSALTVTIVAISVVVVVALSAAGLYLLQSGPAALEKFDKLGIGFVAKWFGMESPEEGRITIRKPLAAFHQNPQAGELFVVTGEAVNSYRKARASIQVKVSLFDKDGKVLLQKTAYCGNRLSNEQLGTLPMEKIESIMNNQFGDSLSNLGVKPGQPIGFVVALANVPKEAVDFGVEVVGSTVAGQ